MNMLSKVTPWPWNWGDGYDTDQDCTFSEGDKYADYRLMGQSDSEVIPIRVDHYEPIWDTKEPDEGISPKAEDRALIALAPDHALFAAAMVAGKVRWERFASSDVSGDIVFDAMRYATQLDEFGVPKLTDSLRAALKAALGV